MLKSPFSINSIGDAVFVSKRISVLSFCAVLVFGFALRSEIVHAAPITIEASVAGTIFDNEADGFDTLELGLLQAGFRDTFFFREISRAAIEFDLSLLPTDFSEVTFEIRQGQSGPGFFEYEFYTYSGDGILSLADALETATLLTPPFSSINRVIEIDATQVVNDWINAGEAYGGILIKSSREEARVTSFEAYNRIYFSPGIVHNAVPEPSSALMIGLGLAALASSRSRAR